MVSINVPPPQLWGGQHTEMFVDHVTVFSQSVSHIRLSHTILCFVTFLDITLKVCNMDRQRWDIFVRPCYIPSA